MVAVPLPHARLARRCAALHPGLPQPHREAWRRGPSGTSARAPAAVPAAPHQGTGGPELPAKNEFVHWVELSPAQRERYETLRLAMDRKVRDEIERKGLARSQMVILEALLAASGLLRSAPARWRCRCDVSRQQLGQAGQPAGHARRADERRTPRAAVFPVHLDAGADRTGAAQARHHLRQADRRDRRSTHAGRTLPGRRSAAVSSASRPAAPD